VSKIKKMHRFNILSETASLEIQYYIAISEPPANGTSYKNIATLGVTYVETV
jgi:hypothetical protein